MCSRDPVDTTLDCLIITEATQQASSTKPTQPGSNLGAESGGGKLRLNPLEGMKRRGQEE